MLKKMTIEQFVIIDRLDLDLQPGLTILTGETGAGKSILLDALGLMLGDASNPSGIRQGAEQSVIEAQFAPPASNPVWKFLAEYSLVTPPQQDFTVRRVIKQQGAEEMLINGKPVGLDLLKKAGAFLTEIHGQNANQSLLDPSNQLYLLDLSGNFAPEFFKNVADALHNLHRYTAEMQEEIAFYNRNLQYISQMEALAKRIESTGIQEIGLETIKSEHARLRTAHETSEAFQEITSHLLASNGAIKALSSANNTFTRQKNLDAEKVKALGGYLAAALQNARSALDETGRLSPEYDIDTAPLRAYQEKMDVIEKAAAEVKVPIEGLLGYYNQLVVNIARIRNNRERVKELESLIQQSEDDYRHHAHILTEKRIEAGEQLSAAINELLPQLKLLKAEFQVRVEEETVKAAWTEKGFNIITFTARMNPGQPFSPITETASGGELARLVLAVKVVLQTVQAVPTLVFDEVDTGIGGAAAAAVGEQLAHLSETTQVIAITHSPQVACRGDQHLHVGKKTDGVVTISSARMLTMDERVDEISRMLAGDVLTTESRNAAKSLLEEATAAAKARQQQKKTA